MTGTSTLTAPQAIAQQAAELLYACAVSEDHTVAWGRGPVYQAAEQAFTTIVIIAYDLGAEQLAEVRELLSQYGPDDAMQDTSGRGVFSYAQAARRTVAERRVMDAERAAVAAYPSSETEEHTWEATHAELGHVGTAYLSDRQVGRFIRELGSEFRVSEYAGDDLADAAELARIESSACDH